eukprot:TRINITY_DN3884_c0_g4_i2.p1 TRINITY_DN3884_c0_g4~~TRINITY_DN3884_c0_g4_i2.p1  ORF type:complete len:161 (-),score=46.99 TRINITY_DN3884_c0_g4_i2:18-500(-)
MKKSKYSSIYKATLTEDKALNHFSIDTSTRDYAKCTYSTPVKTKYSQPFVSPGSNTFSYADYEVSQLLSCVIQLKEHVSYVNIVLRNALQEFCSMESCVQEATFASLSGLIKEALSKNTHMIEKFASVTGHEQTKVYLSLIHICRCRRIERCRSRWSPYH